MPNKLWASFDSTTQYFYEDKESKKKIHSFYELPLTSVAFFIL